MSESCPKCTHDMVEVNSGLVVRNEPVAGRNPDTNEPEITTYKQTLFDVQAFYCHNCMQQVYIETGRPTNVSAV